MTLSDNSHLHNIFSLYTEFQYTILMEIKKLHAKQDHLIALYEDRDHVVDELPYFEPLTTLEDFDRLENELESKERRNVMVIFSSFMLVLPCS